MATHTMIVRVVGIAPTALRLSSECSAAELHAEGNEAPVLQKPQLYGDDQGDTRDSNSSCKLLVFVKSQGIEPCAVSV